MPGEIDSKQQELNVEQIVKIATQNTKSQYSPEQVYASVLAEMKEAGAIVMRQGNTLFVIHNGEQEGSAMFRALNGDTPQNFIENSKIWIKAIQMAGYNLLVTQYEDPAISNLLRMVQRTGQQYYDPSTQLEITKLEDGKTFQAVIYTDKAQV